jgi:pyruvate dehydrogenase (quinone)
VYKGCSVFCDMILTPEQARRKTVAACQAALTKRGVAVLVVPADISNAAAHEERPYAVHARQPIIRPSDADLDEIAAILNRSDAITIYAGVGCAGAHDEVVATAERLKAPSRPGADRSDRPRSHAYRSPSSRHVRRRRRHHADPRGSVAAPAAA